MAQLASFNKMIGRSSDRAVDESAVHPTMVKPESCALMRGKERQKPIDHLTEIFLRLLRSEGPTFHVNEQVPHLYQPTDKGFFVRQEGVSQGSRDPLDKRLDMVAE